ncbi:hypothetical protein OIO90_004162 [Microbotryomycetes sp. JL221]|nr:hypothetical protein OIO90_004162 [Microbotryomycetes sp. JL221]
MAGDNMLTRLKPNMTKRQAISVLKGVLAYTLVFVLIFATKVSTQWRYPITMTSMVIVSIAGQPGLSTGACISAGTWGMLGVAVGAGCYAILAKLGHSRVAQGFVFWIMLYILAYIKALSLKYFAFSLLAVLVAFNGIYTSAISGGNFVPDYLEDYLKAYSLSFAVVLAVNLLVLPVSAERELRISLVGSIERISTFTHLIAKTYSVDITEEEKQVRDQLNQSIRADFAFLSMKLEQTGLEINWTRWTMADYAGMVAKVQQMQQGLITAYSSLIVMERHEQASLGLVKKGLIETETGRMFQKLRLSFDLLVNDIVSELAVGNLRHQSPLPDAAWEDFLDNEDEFDIEAGQRIRSKSLSRTISHQQPEIENQLARVSERLRQEVKSITHTPVGSRRNSFSNDNKSTVMGPSSTQPHVNQSSSVEGTTAVPSLRNGSVKGGGVGGGGGGSSSKKIIELKDLDRVAYMRGSWLRFKTAQNEYIAKLLSEGVLDDNVLRVEMPSASLADMYRDGPTYLPEAMGTTTGPYRPFITTASRRDTTRSEDEKDIDSSSHSDHKSTSASQQPQQQQQDVDAQILRRESAERVCGSAILRTFSALFGLEHVVENLTLMHQSVVARGGPDQHLKAKRLHLHFIERVPKPPKKSTSDLTLRQAVATVSGRHFEPEKISIMARIATIEKFFRSPTSLFAFKTACAVTVFTVFILAPSLTSWFVNYGLTGGLITIMVALAPTLGQSLITFILQILGTGFGTLYGLLILRIFKDVGGYKYNPFGLVVFLALWAIPLCYIIYTNPILFSGALLALNGAGVLVITLYVYNEVPGSIRPTFDEPAYRAAKAFTALALALAIAASFQVFILRTPARQTLRIKLSNLTFGLSNYSVLFGIYGEALVPIESKVDLDRPPVSKEALEVIRLELMKRERQLQQELIALMPLLKFSAAEPSFGAPFQSGTFTRLIRSHQIILDRLREARVAMGTEGFGLEIRQHLASRLAPYRKQSKRFTRALFYLVSTSLATKSPLPHDLPTMLTAARNIQHDALVLSRRLAETPQGLSLVKSTPFLRYFFYMVAYSGVSYNLEAMEVELREMLGTVEESPFVTQERNLSM